MRRDVFRRYDVLVDGSKVASVKEGETANVEVAPGSYRLSAKIDWAETKPADVVIGPDETVRFVVRPGGTPRQGLRQSVKSPDEYLILERA